MMKWVLPGDIPDDYQVLIDCTHRLDLVFLSYFVACLAAYTALGMADRVSRNHLFWRCEAWRWIGALSLGGGIWAMHFIAMLAFIAPIEIHYHWPTTVMSLLIAVLVSYAVMWVIGREQLLWHQYLLASTVAGIGIAGMHYTGMAAIESDAVQFYDIRLFALSILIAIIASLGALLLAGYFRQRNDRLSQWLGILSAPIMGLAILSMHFTGMTALTLAVPPDVTLSGLQNSQDTLILAGLVSAVSILFIALGLGAAWIDRELDANTSHLKSVSNQLDMVNSYDALTELFNSRAFIKLADQRLQNSAAGGYALLAINIDQFKRINNNLGYQAGDQMLRQIAQRLRAVIQRNDLMGRLSADEFVVLCRVHNNNPGRAREEINGLIARLNEQIAPPFALAGNQLCMTISIGVALHSTDGDDFETLFRHADLALNYCKQRGRNRSHWYDAELSTQASNDLLLEQDLRQALNSQSLAVYYQPIIAGSTHAVVGIEALVRWHHPRHGFISPERFIALAEQQGFISELDYDVLQSACRDLIELHAAGYTQLRVAVNCSALNLANPQLADNIAKALHKSGLAARHLALEVTENAVMDNLNTAIRTLQDIRALGVSLSIDDFGSGYSSLAYLQKLPVNVLKIDRSFISDIPDAKGDCAITAAIIAMAHKLDLKVVAEGVETAEQQAFLHQNHCDMLQGYRFSKPLPLSELKTFLANHHRENPPVQSAADPAA